MTYLQKLPTDNRGTAQALWALGGPVAIQSLLTSCMVFLDTLMVSALGPAALGGVGLGTRALFVITMILVGIASGTSVLVAQYCGAGRSRAIRGPVTAAIGLGVLVSLPAALASLFAAPTLAGWMSPDPDVAFETATFLTWSAAYTPLTAIALILGATCRSLGNTRSPLWAGLVGLALNALLNYLLITGRFGLPALGVSAAAIATTLARVVEIVWLLWAMKPGFPRWMRGHEAKLVWQTSLPLILKEVFWAGGIFASTVIVSQMGKIPLAAFNLITPIEGIMISSFVGCGVASGILLGHALGRRAFAEAYATATRLRVLVPRWAMILGGIMAILVQLLRESGWLHGLISPDIHDLALNSLTVLCIAVGARTHNMMVSLGILRSGNDLTWLLLVDLCSMWLLNIPLVAFTALVLKWPLPAVVSVMMLEELLKVLIFRWRVKSGRWMNVIGNESHAKKNSTL